MKTDNQIKEALHQAVADLRPLADAGDGDACIELAMGEALIGVLDAGYKLSDLEWFEGTSYYTGDRLKKKAA